MRLKKFFVAVLASIIPVMSAVPALAVDNELFSATSSLMSYVRDCEMEYIYYGYNVPCTAPIWSPASRNRMLAIIDETENKTYETLEDVAEQRAKVEQVVETMTVSSHELEFMIDIYEKEENYDNYYSDEAWSEFTALLEDGKIALENGDEENIHLTYIRMRNGFNKLCLYNTVAGDVNNDTVVDVKDVTYLQIKLAQKANFTSSQKLVLSGFDEYYEVLNSSVSTVTNLQMYLAGYKVERYAYHINNLIKDSAFDEELLTFHPTIDNSNEVYDKYRYKDLRPNRQQI